MTSRIRRAGRRHDPPAHCSAAGRSRIVAHPSHEPSPDLDNLTHSLVGAAISKAGAERTTPLATATLVLAANAPDFDVLAYTRGEYFALAFRRGITHGLPAMVVLPLAVVGVMLAWDRWVRRRRTPEVPPARAGPLMAWATVALLTHPVLDWMNTYGMRWWMPFDGSWTYGDALFIIDPWLWLVLGGAVFLSSRPGRIGLASWGVLGLMTTSAVLLAPLGIASKVVWVLGVGLTVGFRLGDRPSSAPGRTRVVRAGGSAVIVYIVLMLAADVAASGQVTRAAREAGLEVTDVMVAPEPANPFRASVEVVTPDGIVPGAHRWVGPVGVDLRPARAVPFLSGPVGMPRARLEAVAEAARRDPHASNWLVWARYPYVRVESDGGGWLVRFSDARYDDRGGTGGLSGVIVRLGPDLQVVRR